MITWTDCREAGSANLGQRHISGGYSNHCFGLLVRRVNKQSPSLGFGLYLLPTGMMAASPVLHHQCVLQTSSATGRRAVVMAACPFGRYTRQYRRPSSKCGEVRRCRTQCASSSEQQTSTSGRQDAQHALSHSDRYRRGQKGMPYKLISTLALGGTALTAYLALSKLSGAPVVCLASGGCGSVLNSEYATVFGIPLSLLGLGAYSAVTALAVKGSLSQTPNDVVTRYGVLAGGAVLASCSSSLLYVLLTRFQGEACTWCLTSAGLSFGILAAACSGFSRRQLQEVAPQGGGLIAATILFLSLAWSGIDPQGAEAVFDIPYQSPAVTTQSSSKSEQLAKRLKDAGAKMYGAFWCSHCHEQKEAFGSQAMKDFPYVECYPDGFRKFDDLAKECKDAKIQAFPAWIIKGQTYSGAQSFDKLEKILDN